MLKAFEEFAKNIKFKPKLVDIDNFGFRLHYRITFWILMVSTILVTSRQYIGEHIRCIVDASIPTNVVETYCFFTSTYTVVRHTVAESLDGVPHPGVGPVTDDEPIIRHAYYQWVPFVLFGQALAFYAPHFIWRNLEGGRIKALVQTLQYTALASADHSVEINANVTIPSKNERQERIVALQNAFLQRLHINRPWAWWLVACELLNGLNLIAQFLLTDAFLGGRFFGLGPDVSAARDVDLFDPLDIVFPKVTKCNFHKYGPSGSIQKHDAMCVMALNIINEKIYIFLWYWFVLLAIVTVLSLTWRVATIFLHSRSDVFNRYAFWFGCSQAIDVFDMMTVTRRCYFSDWLFLRYMAKNMDGFVFKDLFHGLAYQLDNSGSLDRPAYAHAEAEPFISSAENETV